ncbi:MAG: flippase [Reichenbachiella sp.]|uniref:flippase n=1 Tax=Reichenbachiella sp. TaxID=2184521 RepID=UPI0032991075
MGEKIFDQLGKKRSIVNYVSLIGEKGMYFILSITIGVYFINYLGPELFGRWSFAMSFVLLLAPFAQLGYSTILLRELIGDSKSKFHVLGSGFLLNTFGSLIIYTIICAVGHFLFDTEIFFLVAILGLTVFSNVFSGINTYFESKVSTKYNVIGNLIGRLISSIGILVLIYFTKSLYWFAFNYLLGVVIAACISVMIYSRLKNQSILQWRVDFSITKTIAIASLVLALKNGFNLINSKIDQIFITELIGFESLGIYAVSAQYTELLVFIPGVIFGTVFPSIIKDYYRKENIKGHIIAYNALFFYLGLMLTLGVFFLAPIILPILFSNKFYGAVDIMKIHAFSILFIFIGVPTAKIIVLKNLLKELLLVKFSGAMLNVFLNMFLITSYGLNGAAIATIISYSFSSTWGYLMFKSTRDLFLLQVKGVIYPIQLLQKRLN